MGGVFSALMEAYICFRQFLRKGPSAYVKNPILLFV